ncbi:MAG: DNA repair protein RecO [Ruminococcus sp.]|nr:DNA repair protein RecO [Ruminococcus sp.]
MTTLEGIVLKERTVGEQDKFIDVLTKEKGLIEISVKGARKINGKSASSTQLFAYSKICFNENKGRFHLNSAEPIHIFYGLRNSLTAISLASYFADILRFSTVSLTDSGNVLRLFLNTLHFLENGLRSETMLKAVFELRLMAETGFMPDIICCRSCGSFEPEKIYFSLKDYCFRCCECSASDENSICLTISELTAIRHIVLADFNRLFNFRLSDESMCRLAGFSELYILSQLERKFNTLDFYKSLNGK